jgi:hypothetical protein
MGGSMFGLFIELKINDKIDRFVYSAIEIEPGGPKKAAELVFYE